MERESESVRMFDRPLESSTGMLLDGAEQARICVCNLSPKTMRSITPLRHLAHRLEEAMATSNISLTRFIGLDVHKYYVVLGAVNAQQEVVLRPRRLSFAEFEGWQEQKLQPTDAVVLEATSNAWTIHDQLVRRAASVVVANPLQVKWIAATRVKTDPHDTLKLARLLAAGLIPTVWVPPQPVRELRALASHRQRLIRQRTQARNRLHSVLQRHNLTPPEGNVCFEAQRAWWQTQPLDAAEQLLVAQDLSLLDTLTPLIEQVETTLRQRSVREPWVNHVPLLVQQTGIGVLTAMIVLAAIGDIQRFERAPQLVGYAGLGSTVHDSGETHTHGGITKQGRRDLRTAMVEAAWVAVVHNPYWKARFERLSKRLGRSQAIVAIARLMLVALWHMWHDGQSDCHGEATAIARKMMTWAEQGGRAMRPGLTAAQFVRLQLDRLGVGQDLTELKYGNRLYSLPASGSVKRTDGR